jgi:hypothetical protein
MAGTRMPFSSFYAKVTRAVEPIVAYVIKLPIPMYSKKGLVTYCLGGNLLIHNPKLSVVGLKPQIS